MASGDLTPLIALPAANQGENVLLGDGTWSNGKPFTSRSFTTNTEYNEGDFLKASGVYYIVNSSIPSNNLTGINTLLKENKISVITKPFGGSSSTDNGYSGLVPAPAPVDNQYHTGMFLSNKGVWVNPNQMIRTGVILEDPTDTTNRLYTLPNSGGATVGIRGAGSDRFRFFIRGGSIDHRTVVSAQNSHSSGNTSTFTNTDWETSSIGYNYILNDIRTGDSVVADILIHNVGRYLPLTYKVWIYQPQNSGNGEMFIQQTSSPMEITQ